MTPIRVLQLIASSRRGGAEGVVAALATERGRERIQSEVGLLEPGWLAGELAAAGVRVHWFAKRRTLDWPLLMDLTRFIRQERPDVIHCHLGTMNLYGCLAARLGRRPAIAHVHGVPHDLDRPRRRWVQRQAWHAADRVVVVSDCIRGMARRMGVPARKIATIPNGVRLDAFQTPRGNNGLRQALGIAEMRPVVAVISRLELEKGVDLALDCFERVCRQLRSAVLLIAGDGSQRKPLEEKAARLRPNGSVRFLGQVDRIAEVLSMADVVLVPARWEAFSLVAIEAMASGVPVIAWDQQGPQEIVIDCKTGRLVPAFDVSAMADAAVKLLSDAGAARAMGAAGRARVERYYSLDGMLEKFEHLYASLCQENGRGKGGQA